MKRNKIGLIASAMALGIAGLTGAVQVTQGSPVTITEQGSSNDNKALPPKETKSRANNINNIGGLNIPYFMNIGRSPKEYGQTFGCKKHGKKSNRLRYSHNAKVARR